MNKIKLSSSTIESVEYNYDHGILEVEFKTGSVYQYYGIPDYIYEEMLRAESPGAFFDLYVKKSGYEFMQVK